MRILSHQKLTIFEKHTNKLTLEKWEQKTESIFFGISITYAHAVVKTNYTSKRCDNLFLKMPKIKLRRKLHKRAERAQKKSSTGKKHDIIRSFMSRVLAVMVLPLPRLSSRRHILVFHQSRLLLSSFHSSSSSLFWSVLSFEIWFFCCSFCRCNKKRNP